MENIKNFQVQRVISQAMQSPSEKIECSGHDKFNYKLIIDTLISKQMVMPLG